MKANGAILGIKIFRIALITVLILIVPLFSMLFMEEMKWGPEDFAVAGVLLFGTGVIYELVARNIGDKKYRIAIGVVLALALAIFWAQLAVGIFD